MRKTFLIIFASITLLACDNNGKDGITYDPDSNVVEENAAECPRADGTPCR